MIVCLCKGVSANDIGCAVAAGAQNVREVAARCRAGTGCGACLPMIREMVAQARSSCDGCPLVTAAESPSPSPYLRVASR